MILNRICLAQSVPALAPPCDENCIKGHILSFDCVNIHYIHEILKITNLVWCSLYAMISPDYRTVHCIIFLSLLSVKYFSLSSIPCVTSAAFGAYFSIVHFDHC